MKLYLLIAFILIEIYSEEETPSDYQPRKKKILRNENEITTIIVQLCQSWSSGGYFRHMKETLEAKYSDVNVIPEPYPLKNPRKLIYNLTMVIETLIIIIISISDYIKPTLKKYFSNDLVTLINENKLSKISFVVLIGLYVFQMINNAGAFEVFCDGKLIWSTIEKNGVKPTLSTIVKIVKSMK